MKNVAKMIVVVFMSMMLWACQPPSVPKEVATEIATNFINATTSGDYEKAFTYVNAKEFFLVRPKERWVEYYDAISQELGPIVSIKLTRFQADDRFSGRFYTYVFSIKHEKGFTKELVTLIQQINSKADLEVFAHKIEGGKLSKINTMF